MIDTSCALRSILSRQRAVLLYPAAPHCVLFGIMIHTRTAPSIAVRSTRDRLSARGHLLVARSASHAAAWGHRCDWSAKMIR